MRPTNSNHVNWIVLSLIGLSCLYFIISHSITFKENTYSHKFFGNFYTNQHVYNFSTDHQYLSFKTGVNYYNINSEEHKYQKLQKYKTDRNTDLWRSLGNNKLNYSRDKVIDLMKWIEDFSKSEYLKHAKPKRILVFDGFESYYGTDGKIKCPFNDNYLITEKCILNEDKLLGVTNYAEFDTFVSVRNWKHIIYDRKIPLIKHVFFIEESPFVVKYADLSINNAILASYWRGSDIVLPYGHFSRFTKEDKTKSVNGTNLQMSQPKSINYAKGKTKLVAIIVSNCEARNDRLRYVKELKKHIPVHDYGNCGPYKCDNCFELVKNEYKFYLAFENANCRDYITEKFWRNALRHDVVPVVLGAHPEDYKALAPPKSYIHVEDFQSPKHLADYLLMLDNNDTLYNEYFNWKRIGRVASVWQEFFCRVCGMLFFADFHPPPTWSPQSTWRKVNRCLPYNKWYWTRADSEHYS